jgi:hypothetical protein
MVLPKEKTSPDRRSPSAATASTDEGTIGTSSGKARCKPPFLVCELSVFFCTCKIQGDQDRAFLFRGGLMNYKAHYGLSWFRPLLGGISPTSNGLILKMKNGYNGVSRELEKFVK